MLPRLARPFLAPLALALALAGCATTRDIIPQPVQTAVDWSTAASTEVLLTDFDFEPETVRLAAGVPLRLTLRDVEGGHTFTAPEFFAAARIAPEDAAEIADGEVHLKEGQSTTLRLIPAAGRYRLVCTHTGHALLGMTGEIIVE